MILVCLAFVACLSTSHECTVLSSTCAPVTEQDAEKLHAWCDDADACIEPSEHIYVLQWLVPPVVERKM